MYGTQSTKRELRAVSRWHPQAVAYVRIGVGIWLLCLTAILYSAGHGGAWESVLVVIAAVHFYLAHRLFRAARRDAEPRTMLR